ncbi:hypothetical protein E2C01_062471 [Portunus trituberculatus]|uniref:Uncharacterized protein n=1 Tax=Portunus trituberculatus TaxID=210409 RepID=A0A5B7HDR6_PORTR|nr:hypothetical protein [Portunus trituberculatus]
MLFLQHKHIYLNHFKNPSFTPAASCGVSTLKSSLLSFLLNPLPTTSMLFTLCSPLHCSYPDQQQTFTAQDTEGMPFLCLLEEDWPATTPMIPTQEYPRAQKDP